MLWHRMRGHRITKYRRNVDTSIRGHHGECVIEQGRIDRGHVCSCGERWPLSPL